MARIAVSPRLARHTGAVLAREQFEVVHLHEPLAPALPLTTLQLLKGIHQCQRRHFSRLRA